MGIPVNLLDAWEPYKAARIALGNTLQAGNIQSLVSPLPLYPHPHDPSLPSPSLPPHPLNPSPSLLLIIAI